MSELEDRGPSVRQLENPAKFVDFDGFPYVNYIGNFNQNPGFRGIFNSQDLYLRAQIIFFITVCFKTQAFELYSLKNKFLKVLDHSGKNGVRKS